APRGRQSLPTSPRYLLLTSPAAPSPLHSSPTRRSSDLAALPGVTVEAASRVLQGVRTAVTDGQGLYRLPLLPPGDYTATFKLERSEEHTSELQSQSNLVCRLLLEKKKIKIKVFRISHTS